MYTADMESYLMNKEVDSKNMERIESEADLVL
jgi:hypothetical protein